MRRLVTLGGIAAAIAATMVLATPLRAQWWDDDDMHVPPGHRPPSGMCRVWYDNVPPGRQPRATDCSTAELLAARSGARVVYGDRARHGKKAHDRRRDNRRYETIDGRQCVVTESRNGDWARYDCRRRDDRFPWDNRSSRDRDRDDHDRDGRYSRDDGVWHRAPDGRYCTASYEYCRKDEPLPQRVDQRSIPRNDTRIGAPGTPRIEPRERTRESIKPNGR